METQATTPATVVPAASQGSPAQQEKQSTPAPATVGATTATTPVVAPVVQVPATPVVQPTTQIASVPAAVVPAVVVPPVKQVTTPTTPPVPVVKQQTPVEKPKFNQEQLTKELQMARANKTTPKVELTPEQTGQKDWTKKVEVVDSDKKIYSQKEVDTLLAKQRKEMLADQNKKPVWDYGQTPEGKPFIPAQR